MTDVDELIALLERWRDATGVGRVGVATDAARIIRGMSPQQKRSLASEVAERVAPQLVPQIQAEEGDLSREQVAAVVDLLRRADREQLDDLLTALRTGDVDASLAFVDDAVTAVEDVVPPQATAAVEDRVAGADAEVDRLLDEEIDGLESAPDVDADADVDVDAASSEARATAAIDEEAVREAAEAAAAERAARWRDTSRLDRPAYELPEVSFDIDVGDVELPDPTVEEVAPLDQRRHELPGSTAEGGPSPRRAPGDTGGGELAAGPTPMVVAAVTATPDGYRRRRAALAAIREGRLAARDDVLAVVRSLGAASDRAWVAGAALDAGTLDAGDLPTIDLAARTRDRLRRRAAAG